MSRESYQLNTGHFCVLLDSSRGLRLGHGGEDVRHRRAGAGLRPRRQRGVRARAGAAGVRGIDFGGGPDGPPPKGLRRICEDENRPR